MNTENYEWPPVIQEHDSPKKSLSATYPELTEIIMPCYQIESVN